MGGVLEGYRQRLAARIAAREADGTTEPDSDPHLRVIVCQVCRDQGMLWAPWSPERPNPVGVRCGCQPAIDTARLVAFTELTPGLRSRTFEALGPPHDALTVAEGKAWRDCWQTVYRYARAQVDLPWLVLGGSVGWGKTHLAVAVLNWRIDHPEDGQPGKYVNCPDFLAHLRQGIDEGGFEDTLTLYREVPLLVLDDLGAEYQRRRGDAPTWADEQIYRVMDHRYRERMPTIVTTNVSQANTPARLRDRLRDRTTTTAFGLDLPSYRTGEVVL